MIRKIVLFLIMDEKQRFQIFENWAKNQQFSLKELFPTINKNDVFHIDLSINNSTVKTVDEFNNPIFFEQKLDEIQQKNPKKIIAGGYLEKRALYTSDIYKSSEKNSTEKRNTHLGIDFWLPEKTPFHAIIDGKIICAIHQKSLKGYGGFIILKHTIENLEFYTLYGHLSEESISKFSKNDKIKKGDKIGELGSYTENGEWVPHLHFQIMLSLLDYENDFPGVAFQSEIEFWKYICPNPNMILKSDALN